VNRAILIGNLASDPEVMQTGSGITRCAFRLATQRKYVSQNGQKEADFHSVVAWRQLGELCGKYLAKGRKVSVEGTIQYRSYQAQDGSTRYVTEIIAQSVEFLSAQNPGRGNTNQENYAPPPEMPPITDDELPF